MIRFLLITVVFASQAFGHKGMLREKVALKEAHGRLQAYDLKPGCFFVDPAIEGLNDHHRSRSVLRTRSNSVFGVQNTVEETQNHGSWRSDGVRMNTVNLSTSTSVRFGAGRHLENLGAINSTPTPARHEGARFWGNLGATNTSTLNASAAIETRLEAWSREHMPTHLLIGNAEDTLKRAVRKVYAERRRAQRSDGQGDMVNLTQLLQDPHIGLWRDLPRLVYSLASLDNAFEQIKANRPVESHDPLDNFRRNLEASPLYVSNPDFFAGEICDIVNAALNRQQDQIAEATRQSDDARVHAIIENGPFSEIAAQMIAHADSCTDAVVSAFETIYGLGVSMKLEKAMNRGRMTLEDSEKAFLSFCLSLLKQYWIRGYAVSVSGNLGGGEIIERQLQANKLVNQVFPMGTIVDRARYNFGFDPMQPRGLAEHLCQSNVAFLVASVFDLPVWKRYVEGTQEYQALKAETEADDFDNWEGWKLRVDALVRDKAQGALQRCGYLTQNRNYPLPNIN